MILDLSADEINVILAALGVQPHNQVRLLIDKIYGQAQGQSTKAIPIVDAADLQANGQPPEAEADAVLSAG